MTLKFTYPLSFALISLALSGCASPPFNLEGANLKSVPQQTLDDSSSLNSRVVWGGLIVGTRNDKDSSTIEVLSYPLDSSSEPQRSANAQGRFLIKQEGYVEPATFVSGRWISAIGVVAGKVEGKVGEADYTYPVMKAENTYLWPEYSAEPRTQTRFSIGVGVGVGGRH